MTKRKTTTSGAGKILASNMRRRRQQLDMSQVKMATASGMNRKTVRSIESEEHTPRLDKIEAIASALCTTPWELLRP